MNNLKIHKYHALGNDYLVIHPQNETPLLSTKQVQIICHRNYGPGADGVLFGPLPSRIADFRLRIFNPDGSEAEKSGNGLRIFARYLWDQKFVANAPFTIETLGGLVQAVVLENGRTVRVAMGQVSFWSDKILITGDRREVLLERLKAGDREFDFCAASLGNPHCIIPLPEVSANLACQYGSLIENHPLFINRTNVQWMQVLGVDRIRIEIWERGAGYTLASGSSSCAAAATAVRLGYCTSPLTVFTPGGKVSVEISADFQALLTGPVVKVYEAFLSNEIFL